MESEPRPSAGASGQVEDYRQVFEDVALPVLVIDHETWRVLAVNEAAVKQYGYGRDEFVGMPILQLRPPEGRPDAWKILSRMSHSFWKATAVEHQRKDGSRFSADVWSRDTVVDGRDVRVATVSEVTERVQLQRELQQAQKMEVVGQLAAGIAHEFNNALAAVLTGSDLLAAQILDRPEALEDLERIQDAARRAASLTRHLLAFSRQQMLRLDVRPLGEVVEGAIELIEPVIGADVELESRIDPGTWPVQVDVSQLEQVIVSLVMNAQAAMPRGGQLLLATANVSVPDDGPGEPGVAPGDYAELVVRDTGTGMDEITRSRVFEPFFTTKPPPEGTGLGLSAAYGIVRQSGGSISVESAPGEGATFRILLPRAEHAGAGTNFIGEPGGDLTVLVVDDDDAVRRSTCQVLESLGHTVLSAGSAEEALAEIEAVGRAPDLLVVDLALPGVGGQEFAVRLRALDPTLPVLFLSGYAMEGHQGLRHPEEGQGLLQKPFSVESLTEAVRRMLAGGPPGSRDVGGTSGG